MVGAYTSGVGTDRDSTLPSVGCRDNVARKRCQALRGVVPAIGAHVVVVLTSVLSPGKKTVPQPTYLVKYSNRIR